jgi:hypothetical protein
MKDIAQVSTIDVEATQSLTPQHSAFPEAIGKDPEMVQSVLTCLVNRLRWADRFIEGTVFLNLPARLAKKRGIGTDKGAEIDLHLT